MGHFYKEICNTVLNQNTNGGASKVNFCELSLDWQISRKTKLCTFAQVAVLN